MLTTSDTPDATPSDRCPTSVWYPEVRCLGSPYLLRWSHPLLGARWTCLDHAIHVIRNIPDAILIDVPDDAFASEVRMRATTQGLQH